MDFAEGVVKAAWDRQGGRCARCGRWLIWAQRGRESITGAWQPHHKNPDDQDKRNAVANCIIFCSGIVDCHFKEGHGGIDWKHHASLDDSRLLFLRTGEETEQTPASLPEQKGSLIGAFLGLSQAPVAKRRGSRKGRPKRMPQGRRPRGNGKKRSADGLGVASDL